MERKEQIRNMAKQLNVNLGFTADTSQAKKQIQDLQNQLTQLINSQAGYKGLNLGIDQELQKASVAAATLQQQLTNAMNVDTGKLDLGKFTQEMKTSGMSMEKYREALVSLGPQGAQAFSSLAQSVMTAEIPLKRSNAMLREFGTTLKNTVRWQFSSSIMHGFMGAIQGAYGYAQDLNESLNSIRIVTGNSVEEMDRFAQKANKAAQALSTTTTAYTDAALIFYQQGLNDSQVEERTNATIKMAQAAGENATEVSSYMTAIWNNFDDGSKSLEYYGDVMASLGAKTAASSAEIAAGLEKFASIGKTVGLSYEFATAAVATVVDKTRQSADTVGTAFKTIFARLQGLQLGETLEDGVDLNKYSKALATVGVEVLDLNGNLRDADDIISDLGHTWDDLSRAQQTALAQTVAGTRQYTQLMSLMNNFDDFEMNVENAEMSTGTLDEQSATYAESWEAARDRVTASLEDIYAKLLDDDFFIGFLNTIDKIVDGVSGLIDGLGGLSGVILAVGAICTKIFAKDLTNAVDRAMYNIQMRTEKGRESIRQTRDEASKQLKQMYADSATPMGDITGAAYTAQAEAQEELIKRADKMTESQRGIAQILMDQHQTLVNNVAEQAKLAEEAERAGNAMTRNMLNRASSEKFEDGPKEYTYATGQGMETSTVGSEREAVQQFQELTKQAGTFKTVVAESFASGPVLQFTKGMKATDQQMAAAKKQATQLKGQLGQLSKIVGRTTNENGEFTESFEDNVKAAELFGKSGAKAFDTFEKAIQDAGDDPEKIEQAISDLINSVGTLEGKAQGLRGQVIGDGLVDEDATKQLENMGNQAGKAVVKMIDCGNSADGMGAKLDAIPKFANVGAQGLVALAGTLSTVGMALQSVKGLIDTWNNEDMSFGDKLLQTFTTLAMVIPMVTSAFNKDTREKVLNTAASIANALAKKTNAVTSVAEAAGEKAAEVAKKGHTKATIAQTIAQWAANASMGPFLLIILAVIAAIAILVAGVLLLVAAFNAMKAASPEGQLESAKEATLAAAAAAETAKEAYEDLRDTIESYDSAVESLEGLTKGTDEFTDAVMEANEAARKLIDTYGLTSTGVDENGVIQIDENELARKKKEARETYEDAASAHTGAQKFQNQKEDGVTYSDVASEMRGNNTARYQTYGDTTVDVADNNISQANVQKLFEHAQGVEGGLGALLEGGEGSIIDAMGWDPEALTSSQEGFIEAVLNSKDALMEANTAILENKAANEALTKAQLAQNLSNEETFQNSDYKDEILGAVTAQQEQYNTDAQTELDGMTQDQMYEKYAEVMGYSHDGIGTWLDGKEEFTSADGSETYKLTPEQVEAQLKEYYAQQNMESDAIDLVKVVDDVMGRIGDNGSELLSAALTGDASNLDVSTLAGIDTAQLAASITPEELEALGFTDASELEAALEDSKQAALDAWKAKYGENADAVLEYFTGLSDSEKEVFLQVNTDVYETVDEIKTEVDRLNAEQNVITLKTQLEGIEEAQGALSEDMSRDDYNTIKESIDWGNEEQGIIEFNEFLQMSYAQQQEYLENLHQATQENLVKNLEAEKAAAQESLAIAEAKAKETQARIDEIMKDGISEDEMAEYEELTVQVEVENSEVTRLEEQIKDCDAEIEIEVKLEGEENFKELLNDLEDMKGVNDSLVKDIKQVGSNYELTAEQARAWANVYPEMLENATVTSEGIVQLNADEANAFIEGKEAELIAAGEAEIAKLEMDKAALEAKKAKAQAEVDLAIAAATAETDVERDAALMQLEYGNALTEALIANDISETTSNQLAAAAMAGNEEEFARVAAECATDMNGNFNDAAYNSAMAIYSAMQSGAKNVDEFRQTCADAATQFKNIGSGVVTGGSNSVSGPSFNGYAGSYTAGSGQFSGHEFEYEGETISLDNFISNKTLEIEGYDAAIGEINTRIAEIRGSMAASLNTYTPGTQRNSDAYDEDGSGSDSDSDKEKEIEELEEVAERYHEINREIEYYNSLLDENSKKKDRAFGKDKLKYMKEEQRLLDEKYKREKDLFDLQTAFLASDQTAIEDVFSGATFDTESGELTNYTDMLQQATDRLNQAKETYNSSAQEDADKEALEKAEEQYEKEIALLEQYEETLDSWREQKANLQDLADQIYDAKLEELDYKVQMEIEVADDELQYLEYLLERIENKAFSAADAIANLGKQTQEYIDKNNAYETGMKEIFGNHGLTDEDYEKWMQGDQATIDKIGSMSFTEDEVEKLREYRDGLLETNQALIETRQAVHDKMIATFEEQNKKLDEGIAKLEHYKAVTESYKNIVDLVGKSNFKDSDKAIKALNSSMVTQSANIAKANIAKRDKDKAELEATRKAFEQQKDKISEDERKMWEDTIKQMEESLRESEEAAMGSIETWMQAVNDKFIAEIEATMDRFAETVSGKFKNLNELQEAFERRQSENDRYLDDYKKIYEFSKLNRDIEKSIDQTDNVRAKKELLKLQEEINELEESGAEVSEYQMENLRKRYELKLAELALEEAQNAKSQVRMSVDNEGNWGYVYTADASQVAAAEQSYEDKLFELQEQNAEYINTLQENIIQMQIEMKDKLAEIANDESLSIEERQAKMAEVQEYYKGQMDYYASEMNLVCDNNKQLYTEDWTAYAERTDYKISEDEKYVDSFEETDLAILTGFENMAQYQQTFNDASSQMLSESNMAFNTWEEEMDAALDAAGLDFEDLSNDMQDKLEEIEGKSNETAETIKNDAEQMVEDYQTVVDAVIEWETQYSTSVDNMLTATEELITKFNEVLALWAQVQQAAETPLPTPPPTSDGDDSTDGDGTTPDSTSGVGGGNDDGMPPDNSSKAEGVAAAIWMDGGATSGWYNGSDRRSRLSEKGVTAAQSYINAHGPNGDIYRSWASRRGQLKSYYYGAFDTGGYTGEWGADGKFAMLHEKELVLNKTDTSNILSAVDIIREISNVIDLNAMSASQGLTSLLGAGRIGEHKESLEQNVTIHAEFPGVSDRNEIQEAFNNLINAASQYANRKL